MTKDGDALFVFLFVFLFLFWGLFVPGACDEWLFTSLIQV
jgi:hypothetical protein